MHVERRRRQTACYAQRCVARSVIDINHFAGEVVRLLERAGKRAETFVKQRETRRFVVNGHDDRQALSR